MSGYSQRPLAAKLGIKADQTIHIVNAPEGYDELLTPLPENVVFTPVLAGPLDFIQFFTLVRAELEDVFPSLRDALSQKGMLWISWPKKSSGIQTDLDGNGVREVGLTGGLVDVKVCAVDDTWSGLKFVRRVKDRR